MMRKTTTHEEDHNMIEDGTDNSHLRLHVQQERRRSNHHLSAHLTPSMYPLTPPPFSQVVGPINKTPLETFRG